MSDEKKLVDLAQSVKQNLLIEGIGRPFRLSKKIEVVPTNTGGWLVEIGDIKGYRCTAQIWIDRFAGNVKRNVYYCISSNRSKDLKVIISYAKRVLGPHSEFTRSDLKSKNSATVLSKKLAMSKFGHPIVEHYKSIPGNREKNRYGVYETNHVGLKRNEFNRLVGRISDYFKTVVDTLPEAKETPTYNSDYSGVENRRIVKAHLGRERKSHLATMRKQFDDYICQVCGFDFQKKYGKLGEDFAEAHHKVPLSKINKVKNTNLDDLITVCSNCHRMLHKMDGKAGDIDKLESIIKKKFSWKRAS